MKASELRRMLREKELETSGRKEVLIRRLKASKTREQNEKRTPQETQPMPKPTLSHNLFKVQMDVRNNLVLTAIDNLLKNIIEKGDSLKKREASSFDKTVEILSLVVCFLAKNRARTPRSYFYSKKSTLKNYSYFLEYLRKAEILLNIPRSLMNIVGNTRCQILGRIDVKLERGSSNISFKQEPKYLPKGNITELNIQDQVLVVFECNASFEAAA